jgi:diguanylate cyclase (GGDEF)-like protein
MVRRVEGNFAHDAGARDGPAEADRSAEHRDRSAEDRDQRAEDHDQAAEARDERANARDERAEARERAADAVDDGAAADRSGALRDRRRGASDRTQAADDRRAASADRALAARERTASSIDELTGVHRREAGYVELRREIARAKRTKQPFALAFVDVDDLKRTNDSLGHAAGDQLLRETADAIRGRLRSYDLVIRFGGDEFLCGLLGVTVAEAADRFSLVNADLAATQQASISFGLTELESDDALEDLIARADDAMYKQRQRVRSARA